MAKATRIPAEQRSTSRFLARMLPGARPSPVPAVLAPCLPRASKSPPRGANWLNEIRFSGRRIVAALENGRVRLVNALGEDQSRQLGRIASALTRLPVNAIVLDGVVAVQDREGLTDSALLEADIRAGRQDRLVYFAFDLLHLDGFDIASAPLVERKRVLASLLEEAGPGPVAFSAHVEGNAAGFLDRVKSMGLAGIVAKRPDAPYRAGPGRDWIEVLVEEKAQPAKAALTTSSAATRPLLIIDGDSFAHRAYHALPKSIRRIGDKGGGAIVGFANYLVRFWREEKPRAVLVGWDTLSEPTFRHEELKGYQSGRQFDKELLEQLDILPDFVAACGFRNGKAAGYEADDFLAAAAKSEEKRGGRSIIASGDRNSFQLASDLTTIIHPMKGGVMARIGPAEVKERYGVKPAQVPDFIALRGDPSDKIPGAEGVGAVKAASIINRYGSLEAALASGLFGRQEQDLRLYKRIATMDAGAPIPKLPDMEPTWDKAANLARAWELTALAERFDALASDGAGQNSPEPRRRARR